MRNCLQTGCLIIGILCFFYYILIVVYAGFRTSIAWIWVLGGALFLFLWRALAYEAAHPGTKLVIVTRVLGILIAIGVLVILTIGSRIVGAMTSQVPADLDYVVVLGAQVRGTLPSRALRRRLDCAVAYAQENPDTIFVLSGGQGEDEGISEAACMYTYLTENGVSADRLLLENRSTSTRENLRFSDELYDLKDRRVGILSNSFHVYRAMLLAGQEGYQDACAIPASSDLWMQPHNILREICAICFLFLRRAW